VGWYRRAADQGLALSQFGLGAMYQDGNGVGRDPAEAARWYRLAADQGHEDAQYNLALMYEAGNGMPQDYVEAYIWYSLATANGIALADEGRNQLAQKMTADEIEEAERLAREWMEADQTE
jgi:TPR repeat protein